MFKDGDGQEEQEKPMWAVIKKVWKRVDPRLKGLKDTFNTYEGRGIFSLF